MTPAAIKARGDGAQESSDPSFTQCYWREREGEKEREKKEKFLLLRRPMGAMAATADLSDEQKRAKEEGWGLGFGFQKFSNPIFKT